MTRPSSFPTGRSPILRPVGKLEGHFTPRASPVLNHDRGHDDFESDRAAGDSDWTESDRRCMPSCPCQGGPSSWRGTEDVVGVDVATPTTCSSNGFELEAAQVLVRVSGRGPGRAAAADRRGHGCGPNHAPPAAGNRSILLLVLGTVNLKEARPNFGAAELQLEVPAWPQQQPAGRLPAHVPGTLLSHVPAAARV